MNKNNSYIDLHTHSICSDGDFAPSEIVRMARNASISAIALTDHFTVLGVKEAIQEGNRIGVEVISGIELDTVFKNIRFHVLGLMIDYESPKLKEMLILYHKKRMRHILRFLNEIKDRNFPEPNNVDLEYFSITSLLSFYKSRLSSKQYGKLKDDIITPLYYENISQLTIPFEIACSVIHGIGGIVILPHLSTINLSNCSLYVFLETLKINSLDGIEVWHPYYNTEQTLQYEYLAEKLKLLKSGGSDFHGIKKPNNKLGQCQVNSYALELIKNYRENYK